MKKFLISLPLLLLFTSPALADLPDVVPVPVVEGLPFPVSVAHNGDGRLYVVLLDGRVMIVDEGEALERPFLDLRSQVRGNGLYSLAFHPGYATNGFFYVRYTEDGSQDSILARFQVRLDDSNRADRASEVELLRIPKAFANHYGGDLHFGPDGFLFTTTGDGTGQGGVLDPQCASQDPGSLEGKVLRLDVTAPGHATEPPYYAVPPSNPFADGSGRGEIWAMGLRNAWRFSFDRQNGDLWIGDVGENRREEVDRLPAGQAGGANLGWKVMEGTRCLTNRVGCSNSVPDCGDPGLELPFLEYGHTEGRCSIIGGFVYRGSRIPALAGRYLYADFCTGEIWAATADGEAERLSFTLPGAIGFGEGPDGEIYVGDGGTLYRLTDPTVPDAECVADDNQLCLNQGRFQVRVTYRTAEDLRGSGHATTLGEDSGLFWFFSPNNPEIFIKVLDACEGFGHYWVFAAGLTDVETSLEVVDTATGEIRCYDRPLGESYEAVRDTSAFATCP